jgi:regulator of sigma E protease
MGGWRNFDLSNTGLEPVLALAIAIPQPIITILAFVVVLGITITVHEFGHFAMAKILRIKVLVFSLGFGPKLAGFTRGGTEYRLSPFPLGGYVKMAGETFDEERKGSPDEFLSHPKWHRFLVAIAGPFMNIFLAVLIMMYSYYVHGINEPRYLKESATVGPVYANSIAKRAGLETGDRIVEVHGNEVKTWEEMELAIGTAPRDALNIEVQRNNQRVQIHFDAPKTDIVDSTALGFRASLPKTLVEAVDKDTPAYKAGLKEGDEILSVQGNGKSGRDYDQILNVISESKGIPLDFEILRPSSNAGGANLNSANRGTILHLTITPFEENGRVLVGFVQNIPSDLEKFGLVGSFVQSARRNYELSALTFKIIGRIFRGSASVKTLSGPIEIARFSGSAARTGSARVFFGFLGLVSLQLGVFNLLPIPILDGGVIALLLVEGLMRRDLSLNLKEKIIQAGFVFLILLMGFVVFNDISKIIDLNRLFR